MPIRGIISILRENFSLEIYDAPYRNYRYKEYFDIIAVIALYLEMKS
jgi:hypothetical protein